MSMFSNYDQRLLDHVTKLHFIGCGGSGMFPLIQILHARGMSLSGSDVEDTKITEAERAMGMRVSLSHDAANIQGVKTTFAGSVNTYDVLNADKLIISQGAAKKLEEVLG